LEVFRINEEITMENRRMHKGLDVWKTSMDLVEDIYKITVKFPISERYGLSQQLRRAAVSIPSNIAEGASRQYNKEFVQFLYISLGSLSEIETQLEIAIRLSYISTIKETNDKMIRIRQMIFGLIKRSKEKK